MAFPEGAREPLHGLVVWEHTPFRDDRGEFVRLFDREWEAELPAGMKIAQVNHSVTLGRGTIRGLHYQMAPFCETKLVACIRGRVYDVVVDVRRGSPNFLQWNSEVLSGEERCTLVVPPGFAHGFQVLDDECELIYIHSQPYRPNAEAGLNPCDPRLDIPWPEPVGLISDRDAAHPFMGEDWVGIDL